MAKLDRESFREEVRNILKDYAQTYRTVGNDLVDKIVVYIDGGMSITNAIDKALADTEFWAVNRAAVVDAVYLAACAGYGVLPSMIADPNGLKNKLLSDSWTPDKMPLSARLHNGVIRQRIVETITSSMRNVGSVRDMARSLYDGYSSGKAVIAAPKLPQYLEMIRSRASIAGASAEYLKKLRGDIDCLLKQTGRLQSPELRTAYQQFLKTCMSPELNQTAIKKTAWVAVQERARYYAERIARTETVRAWFDGFLTENQDDPDVWGYRWTLSTRHKLVPFDQCDVCANMDVGFGIGTYPKESVPTIPRHPHCMCMLEPVYAWEINTAAKFRPDGARRYIDSLPDAKKQMLFGKEGAKRYDNGDDWQKLLRGWDGFGAPKSRLAESDFKNKKNAISDVAIESIKTARIEGMTAADNELIRQKHRELLEYARDENEGKEVAFILYNGLTRQIAQKGKSAELDFTNRDCEIALRNKTGLFVMHNHPQSSSFSMMDLRFFLLNDNVKHFSVIGNNGQVEVLTKSGTYNKLKSEQLLFRQVKKYSKTGAAQELNKAVAAFILKDETILYRKGE